MIVAQDKYTGYILTSSPICMMSSAVSMDILCITNIGYISLEKIIGVQKFLQIDCIILLQILETYLKYT